MALDLPTPGADAGTWGTKLNQALNGTGPGTLSATIAAEAVPRAGRPKLADGIFSAVDTALDEGRSAAIQVQGDSTGNAADEWVYMLTQWLAARHAGIHVKHKLWNDTAQRYDAWEVVQAGTSGERHAYFPANARSFYRKTGTIPATTADLDVRCRVSLDNWQRGATQTLMARYGAAPNLSWRMYISSANLIGFVWSTDGTTTVTKVSSGAMTFTPGQEAWIRCTLDVDNGSGGYSWKAYTSLDGVTWTEVGSSVTTSGGPTTIFNAVATDWEIGGQGMAGGVILGKIYEAQIRNEIDGPIVNPQPIDSWSPRVSSGSFVSGSFGGGGTLYVLNGSQSGAAYTYFNDTTRHPKMVHPYAGSLCFQSCCHNDADNIDGTYLDARTTWLGLTDTRAPGSQTVIVTQNPEVSPRESYAIANHARRRQLLMAWAARKGLALIDTWQRFLDAPGGAASLTQADGVHPTTSIGDGTKGEDVWLDAITDAWEAAA